MSLDFQVGFNKNITNHFLDAEEFGLVWLDNAATMKNVPPQNFHILCGSAPSKVLFIID